MKRYKFTMPTPERAKALGVKYENLGIRTQMWLMGVASGISYVNGDTHCNLSLAGKRDFIIETNSTVVINNIKDRLESYGFITELVTI